MTSTSTTLRQALACAARGWPVFPCQPGRKTPATTHGFRDATTNPGQITEWFTRHPGANLAIATGAPGPDVLDIDQHGPGRNGFPAYARLRPAGLLAGAAAYVRTPSGGMHVYFTGTRQRCGHLPGCHLDFRSAGGYILAPPSRIGSQRYQLSSTTGGHGTLDWDAVTRLLDPAGTSTSTSTSTSKKGPSPARTPPTAWTTWPAGSPPSPRGTATRACSGPPTAPWTPTPPPTSARWPPPPARPASATPRSPAPWTPPAAPPSGAPSHPSRPVTRPRR